MCRLFGFRSIITSQVHSSLVSADNALMVQSQKHPDGWGVAYYEAGAPHVVKSASTAMEDHLFKRVSGVVSSETVIAHIRRATIGESSIINSHPFQYGNWIFVHNGNIQNFKNLAPKLLRQVDPHLRRYVLGDTDSEVLFYLLMTELKRRQKIQDRSITLDILKEAVRKTIEDVCGVIGPYREKDIPDTDFTYLTFLLTNGEVMIAHHGGKDLFYSTHKKRCSERDTCPSFSPMCETATTSGKVSHLLFSSEPLSGENVWSAAEAGDIIGANADMEFQIFKKS